MRFDPGFLRAQAAQAPSEFTLHARNPQRDVHGRRRPHDVLPGPGAAVVCVGGERRDGTLADLEQLMRMTQMTDALDTPGPQHPRAQRRAARRPPPRARARGDPPDRPRLVGRALGGVRRARLPPDGGDRPRLARGDRRAAGDLRERQCQLTVALRRAHARRTAHVCRGRAGRDRHAVPADGGDGARLDARRAGAADSRGAGRDRPRAARAAGRALRDGLVPLERRHEERLAGVRRARVGVRPPTRPARSHGASGSPGAPAAAPSRRARASTTRPATNRSTRLVPGLPRRRERPAGRAPGGSKAGSSRRSRSSSPTASCSTSCLHQFTPVEIDEASLAFGAHAEIRQGGHFFGAEHTLERFRDCFWRPTVASTDNISRWLAGGSLDHAARASSRVARGARELRAAAARRRHRRGADRVRRTPRRRARPTRSACADADRVRGLER